MEDDKPPPFELPTAAHKQHSVGCRGFRQRMTALKIWASSAQQTEAKPPLSVVSEDAPLLRMNARFRVVAASPGTSEMGVFLSVR
jgi:hypothetical protein